MSETSKYEQALSQYNTQLDDAKIAAQVAQLIEEKVAENDTPEVKKFLMGSIELTTLKTTDSEESVMRFTERVNDFDNDYPALPHVATICVYPRFASVDCQVAYFHTITAVESTHNFIDSIVINNPNVDYDTERQHFRIYFTKR